MRGTVAARRIALALLALLGACGVWGKSTGEPGQVEEYAVVRPKNSVRNVDGVRKVDEGHSEYAAGQLGGRKGQDKGIGMTACCGKS